MKNSALVNVGKNNFSLLTFIKENSKLSRKELVALVVSHENFIYASLKHKKEIAWKMIVNAKKSDLTKAYAVIEKRELWICHFDFTMVRAK